jgi:hypothetical protein
MHGTKTVKAAAVSETNTRHCIKTIKAAAADTCTANNDNSIKSCRVPTPTWNPGKPGIFRNWFPGLEKAFYLVFVPQNIFY